MDMDQFEKAQRFRALHEGHEILVIPNPWDAASAKLLASMGFKALTTTSAGLAWTIGKADGEATREESLANARQIVAAVDLPVAADLEKGFGDRPEDVAKTIRMAADAGLVGGSIEDFTGDESRPIFDFSLAVERVAAAAEAAHALTFPFQFVARAENLIHGVNDLEDTVRRLQAYEKAGADVLFAPGLATLSAIRTVCASVGRPVNVVMTFVGADKISLAELAAAGVKRVSTGGGLARAAYGRLVEAGQDLLAGGFGYIGRAATGTHLNAVMRGPG
jgi:2-methylisocitrate lyase-like PEP mutase family enzyme